MMLRLTDAKIRSQILEGRGTGLGPGYRPWIQITKRNTSRISMQFRAWMPRVRRRCHYLSRAEFETAHLLFWLGALDVREQYPLWPWEHAHPMDEVMPGAKRSAHPGMHAVAREAGIELRRPPGVSVPSILSLDLLASVCDGAGSSRLVAISCKPSEVVDAADPCDRIRERLELDRLYACVAEIPHRLVHGEALPTLLMQQLQWLAPTDKRVDLDRLVGSSEYQFFLERFRHAAVQMPIWRAIHEANSNASWSDAMAHYAARTAMWRLDVDVNPLEYIDMTCPLQPGGSALRDSIRSRLL